MEDALLQAGLTNLQAKAYLFLLKNGESSPPLVAKSLSITRSNAYKVLDSLVELHLSSRSEQGKRFVYTAENPVALSGLVAHERNRLIALEKSVSKAMHGLRELYTEQNAASEIKKHRGNHTVISLYEEQAQRQKPIYFIKTRADIPVMGYETMDRLRRLPARFGTNRYGITQDSTEGTLNPAIDRASNLTRTWIGANDYTSPVEWAVSDDELLIISFEDEASAIKIKNPVIARAFQEIWQLLDNALRSEPGYKKLPRSARRKL